MLQQFVPAPSVTSETAIPKTAYVILQIHAKWCPSGKIIIEPRSRPNSLGIGVESFLECRISLEMLADRPPALVSCWRSTPDGQNAGKRQTTARCRQQAGERPPCIFVMREAAITIDLRMRPICKHLKQNLASHSFICQGSLRRALSESRVIQNTSLYEIRKFASDERLHAALQPEV